MYRILEFLRRVYLLLLFLLLEGSAIYIYAHSNGYARAKMLSYTSSIMGAVGGVTYGVGEYFSLRRDNQALLDRVAELEEHLGAYEQWRQDSTLMANSYIDDVAGVSYQAAKVLYNTVNRKHNYLIINRGLQDGVRAGMGVVSFNREAIGVVLECGDRSSVVMSMLNTRFRTGGKVEGSEHAGSIYWGGADKYRVKMRDLSKYVEVKVGDAVMTTNFSQLFPSGVLIGYVAEVAFDHQQISYNLDIDIAADLSSVDRVLVVGYNGNVESGELIERVKQEEELIPNN